MFLGSETEVLAAANSDLRTDFWPLSADEISGCLAEHRGEPFSAVVLDVASLAVCYVAKRHRRFNPPHGVRATRARCFPSWTRGRIIVDMDYEISHATKRKTRVRVSTGLSEVAYSECTVIPVSG